MMAACHVTNLLDAVAETIDGGRCGTPIRRRINVGDIAIEVRTGATTLSAIDNLDALSLADIDTAAGHSDRAIYVGTGTSAGVSPLLDLVTERHPAHRPGSDEALAFRVQGTTYLVSADRTRAAVWYDSADTRPHWERARPLLPAIQGLLAGSGWAIVHSAAIGAPGQRALLLTGASQAGKTTISLVALDRAWQYFGDDVVAISATDGPPRVARVFDSARLRLPAHPALAHMDSLGTPSLEHQQRRRELRTGHLTSTYSSQAPLGGVLYVHRAGASRPTMSAVRAARVVSTVTSTTLQVSFGDTAHHAVIANVCQRLRPVGFDPANDVDRALDVLQLLDHHGLVDV